jgi:hypothetical protein
MLKGLSDNVPPDAESHPADRNKPSERWLEDESSLLEAGLQK